MNTVNPSIFKAYDIRGVYPTDLDEDLAYRIARAYCQVLSGENPGKTLNIVVASDMRLSSPSLKREIIRGVTDSGHNVIDGQMLTTPSFYFSVAYYKYDGGIQVSASHNPKEYNGFKMVRARGVPVGGDTGIFIIRDLVIKNDFSESTVKGKVTSKMNIVGEEVAQQQKDIDITSIKPFKIVVDAANSMGAVDVEAMFGYAPLKCTLVKLNFELNGNFPVHQPDPLNEENLKIIKEAVVENSADLGIAPDGDGDRYFFVDEKGEVIRQEILRGIMAQIALRENPGATVCYDIRPGRITKDMIEEAGGKAVVTRVGHSLIKEKMLETGAVFGGESSGHYFYKFDYGTFEAPVVLVTKFLKYISEQNKPLSQIVAPYKKYFHSGEINSEVEDKEGKIKALSEKYKDGETDWLDGITITYPDYWFNVRASNTEPLLRLNLEAKSKELMEQKREEVLAFIRS
jgi:phosphomannomutase